MRVGRAFALVEHEEAAVTHRKGPLFMNGSVPHFARDPSGSEPISPVEPRRVSRKMGMLRRVASVEWAAFLMGANELAHKGTKAA